MSRSRKMLIKLGSELITGVSCFCLVLSFGKGLVSGDWSKKLFELHCGFII